MRKQSLAKLLHESEETMFVSTKGGETKAVKMDRKQAMDVKKDPNVTSIDTAKGQQLKEQGVEFTKEETTAIAKEVGRALAKALRTVGDEVGSMKAHDIEPNSFEISVLYKGDTSDDTFSFYISDDTLHLSDFSFDKELTGVGVKPSGEAVLHVEVLANELVKHFKSMSEGMSDQEYADAKEAERLAAHPEKSTIEKIQALIASQKQHEDASPEEEEKFHTKLDNLVHKTFGKSKEELKESPEGKYYIKVAVRDARKALAIIDDQPALKHAVEMDGSDTYYLEDEQLAYDLMMDFMAQDVEVTDQNVEEGWDLDEASDYAKRRAAERDYQPSKKDKPAKAYKEPKNDYFERRKKELEYKYGTAGQEMYEEEAPEGGLDKGGDLDVGHQDDEPSMIKKDLYDIATYAAKLYKQMNKYDAMDQEVDFPHWWQKKVALSREYISSAQHYLEAQEKAPHMDALALESINEASAKKVQQAHSLVVAKMKELAKQYKAGDTSVVVQLKDLTATKKELEKKLVKSVAKIGRNQELDI